MRCFESILSPQHDENCPILMSFKSFSHALFVTRNRGKWRRSKPSMTSKKEDKTICMKKKAFVQYPMIITTSWRGDSKAVNYIIHSIIKTLFIVVRCFVSPRHRLSHHEIIVCLLQVRSSSIAILLASSSLFCHFCHTQ